MLGSDLENTLYYVTLQKILPSGINICRSQRPCLPEEGTISCPFLSCHVATSLAHDPFSLRGLFGSWHCEKGCPFPVLS